MSGIPCADIRCVKCNRLIGKLDDGLFHAKHGKRGEQIIVDLKGGSDVLVICPSFLTIGNVGRKCGNETRLSISTINA